MDEGNNLRRQVPAVEIRLRLKLYKMKKNSLLFCWLLLLCGCSQQEKDKDIKEMLSSAAKKELAFAGVSYTVRDGVVTLLGYSATDKDKEKVAQKVKKVSGVKEVVNQLVVAPVVLNGDHSLKQSVDSILKTYPTVLTDVLDSVIILQGEIENKKIAGLVKSINQLQPKGIQQQLVIR